MYRLLVTLVVVLVPGSAPAQGTAPSPETAPSQQGPTSRVEVWAGGAWSPGTTGGVVRSDFAPPLANGTGAGTANLRLTVESSDAFGFAAGARVFLTPHVGFEIGGGRTWSKLSGINEPYSLGLDYVSRQPPDYQPRDVSYTRSVPWPDTRGDRRVTALVAGPALRWTQPRGRVSGTVSGGLSLQRFDGAVRSLVYTEFRLGGHSTLFSSQHRVEVEPEPGQWFAGPYLATDVRVRLTDRAGLAGGVRVHLGDNPLSSRVRVVSLVDPNEDLFVPELSTVQRALEPGAAMDLAAARWQVFAGVTVFVK
jgi:hypothetical protein